VAEHDADPAAVFVIPKTLLFSALLAVAASLGGGGYYMGTQAANASKDSASFDKFKVEVSERFARDEASSKISDDSTTKIDLRLTRMEAQLSFLVNTAAPLAGAHK
jgi:uncharacterized protein HemX